jgi:hypothetical protein
MLSLGGRLGLIGLGGQHLPNMGNLYAWLYLYPLEEEYELPGLEGQAEG